VDQNFISRLNHNPWGHSTAAKPHQILRHALSLSDRKFTHFYTHRR